MMREERKEVGKDRFNIEIDISCCTMLSNNKKNNNKGSTEEHGKKDILIDSDDINASHNVLIKWKRIVEQMKRIKN